MSSTNKTNALGLNQWISSDKPQFIDFNSDNQIIDNAINEHTGNNIIHITADDRSKWDTYSYVKIYFGDGNKTRSISIDAPFKPSAVIVFPKDHPISKHGSNNCHFFGIATAVASTSGIKLDLPNNCVTVTNSLTAIVGSEYASLNETGKTYCMLFIK